tara:strand:+ start:17 stop:655 length:639 start_codon:yes stop_codon:yes gene_type:complete
MSYDYVFKLILLGDSGYGKSSIVFRILKEKFLNKNEPTIGLDFATKTLSLPNGKIIKCNIWDTAGQEAFASIIKTYYKNIACAIIVMDVSDENSFEQAEKWLGRYEKEKDQGSVAMPIIVSNKMDIINRKYTYEQGKTFAETYGCLYMEVSAKTGANCTKLLPLVANHIYNNMDKCSFISEPGIRKESILNEKLAIAKTGRDRYYFNCCGLQ